MSSNLAAMFEKEEIVSYDLLGKPLSWKSDDAWVLEDRRKKRSENVKFIMSSIFRVGVKDYARNVSQAKEIFLCVLRCQHKGESLRVTTLRNHYKLLKKIADYCTDNDVAIIDFMSSPHHLIDYAQNNIRLLEYLPGILDKMYEEGYLDLPYELLQTLRVIASGFEKVQTLAIPPRILSIRTFQFDEVLDFFLRNCRKLARFSSRVRENKNYARSIHTQSLQVGSKNATLPTFAEAIREHGLEEVQIRYSFTGITQFSLFLTVVQFAAKSLIQIFSGMRDSEAKELKYGCMMKASIAGLQVDLITGLASKVTDLDKPGVWVTSKLGVKAIKVARILSRMIYRDAGERTSSEAYLFVSSSYSPFCSRKTGGSFPRLSTRLTCQKISSTFGSIAIEPKDYHDLKNLLPLGELDNHPDLIVGESWVFKSHQFRRSFGIYATASGIANFPSLKSQFNHFKVVTSMAYGESGSAKVEFGGDSNHIKLKYDEESLLMDANLYVNEVLFSSESLHGPKGKHIESVVRPSLNKSIAVAFEDTVKAMKKGRLAYTATILGGCTTTKPCQEKAHGLVLACHGCSEGVIKHSKLIPVIDKQRYLVRSLPEESVEYRTELAQLHELEKFLLKSNVGSK